MERDSSNSEENIYITGAEKDRSNMENSIDRQKMRLSELDEDFPRILKEAADSRGIDSVIFDDLFDVYSRLQRDYEVKHGFGSNDKDQTLLSDDILASLKDKFCEISGQDYEYGCAKDLKNVQDLVDKKGNYESLIIHYQDRLDNTDWKSASLSEKKNDLSRLLNFKTCKDGIGVASSIASETHGVLIQKSSEELDSDASIARGKLAELYNNKVIDSGKFKYLIAALFEVVNEAKQQS